ncbi:MAG: phosphohistidine phosphatase SixA [Desulfobacteraceae bacterium]
MAIYLVQHGQCLSKQEDPEKGLSSQGAADARRIAQVAAGYGIGVNLILHSGKKRARQTAEILKETLRPERGVASVDGINPLDEPTTIASTLEVSSNTMIVGHLPHLERLTAYLVTGQTQKPIFKLQNGGILCLDHYGDAGQVVIKWALMPNVG